MLVLEIEQRVENMFRLVRVQVPLEVHERYARSGVDTLPGQPNNSKQIMMMSDSSHDRADHFRKLAFLRRPEARGRCVGPHSSANHARERRWDALGNLVSARPLSRTEVLSDVWIT
jgi:hypothetical protein